MKKLLSIIFSVSLLYNISYSKESFKINQSLFNYVKNEDLSKIKKLFKQNINIKDEQNYTLLIWASLISNIEIVKYLIENNADINIKDNDGFTVLMYASQLGHKQVVEYLKSNSAN